VLKVEDAQLDGVVVHDRKKLVEAASEDAARRDMPVAVRPTHLLRGERAQLTIS
jgi:hypothetical protein